MKRFNIRAKRRKAYNTYKFRFPKKAYTLLVILLITLTTIGYSAMNETLMISGEIAFIPEASDAITYYCTGETKTLTITESGVYQIKAWGAEGGAAINSGSVRKGGSGGYSEGEVHLKSGTILHINVGCKGKDGYTGATTGLTGGFNGGGAIPSGAPAARNPGSGGGASDVRINSNSLYARVIVAGGGGGAGSTNTTTAITQDLGGQGGGTNGVTGKYYPEINSTSTYQYVDGKGGKQTAGGTVGTGTTATVNPTEGIFGYGGNGSYTANTYGGGAGGGGWYGGGGATYTAWGGGGSGWIYTETTYNAWQSGNPGDASQFQLDSKYYLENATTTAGTTTENIGEGRIEIKQLSVDEPEIVQSNDFDYTGEIKEYTVPETCQYIIEAWGAQGGANNAGHQGYQGAYAKSIVNLVAGEKLKVLVGGKGGYGAGGGGSFITKQDNTPLAVAGGGGGQGGPSISSPVTNPPVGSIVNYGQSTNTGGSTISTGGGKDGSGGLNGSTNGPAPGGGGLLTNGQDGSGSGGGKAFINGGAGGLGSGTTATSGGTFPPGTGGFGGGGGAYNNNPTGYFRGGGGGGYSGGQGGTYSPSYNQTAGGGGGGSYCTGTGCKMIAGNASMPNPNGGPEIIGKSENGYVKISSTCTIEAIEPKIFEFNGAVQTYTIPRTGTYQIETWGADGGSTAWKSGGKGGYSSGTITLTKDTLLYIYVGEKGRTSSVIATPSSFGGGGSLAAQTNTTYQGNAASGGGASDVRVLADSLYNRIIVAGGGGGANSYGNGSAVYAGDGGHGGGSNGGGGQAGTGTTYGPGAGGTPSTGGAIGTSGSSSTAGTFGQGGSSTSNLVGTGGGGGWYGGGSSYAGGGGGGGSGYVLTATSHRPTGYFSQYASYIMGTPVTAMYGTSNFKNNIVTNGNGAVKITHIP